MKFRKRKQVVNQDPVSLEEFGNINREVTEPFIVL